RCPYHCTDQCDKCGHKLAQELDEALNSCYGEAAAFIFEPVSGATLGAVTPPNGYLRDVAGLAKRHGILLIADEVMTGFGRRGYSDERLKDSKETAGHKMRTALRTLTDLAHVGDVRGIGLLWAVEFVADKHARTPFAPEKKFSAAVANSCMKRGVVVYPMQGSVDGSSG